MQSIDIFIKSSVTTIMKLFVSFCDKIARSKWSTFVLKSSKEQHIFKFVMINRGQQCKGIMIYRTTVVSLQQF